MLESHIKFFDEDMKQSALKEHIGHLLENIKRRTQLMDKNMKGLDLEIDLVKDDLRALYRLYDQLLTEPAPADPAPVKKTEPAPADPAQVEEPEAVINAEEPKPAPEQAVSTPVNSTKEDTAEENLAETASATPTKDQPSTPAGKRVLDLLSSVENHTIADKYIKQDDNSLHNRISSSKEDRSIGARMQQHPISSLRDVIGVNEKFLFINELFQGNIQAYNEAIARLNDMDHMKAAFEFLNQLADDFDWDAKRSSTTIEKLANYVQRRHMNQ